MSRAQPRPVLCYVRFVVTAAGGGAMSNRLGRVIHWALALFLLTTFLLAILAWNSIPAAYKPHLLMASLMAPLVAWCLYTLLWHWKELAGREALARIVAGLFGVFVVAHPGYSTHSEPHEIIVTVKPDLSLKLGSDVVTSSASEGAICDPGRIWLTNCARTKVRALIAALEKATGGNHNELIIVRSARGVSPYYLRGMNTLLELAGYGAFLHYTRGRHSPCHVPAGVSGEALLYVSACRRISLFNQNW
jgi:hypothetical protein